MLPNGLFELKTVNKEAGAITLVNGKPIARKPKTLGHMDRIAFPGGVIYVFKYPLLKRTVDDKVIENAKMNEGLADDLQRLQAWNLIQEEGIPWLVTEMGRKPQLKSTPALLKVQDYSELELKMDECTESDWDFAIMEVENQQKIKKDKETKEMEKKWLLEKKAAEDKLRKQMEEEKKKFQEQQKAMELDKMRQIEELQAKSAAMNSNVELAAEKEKETTGQLLRSRNELDQREAELELVRQEMKRKEELFQQ